MTEPWHAVAVGLDGFEMPSVRAQVDEVAATTEEAPLILLGSAVGPGVWTACRRRWPRSWLVPMRGAGPAMDRGAILGVLKHGPATLILDGFGGLVGESLAVARKFDGPGGIGAQAPSEVQVEAVGDAPSLPDLGNRLRRGEGALPMALNGWSLGVGEDAHLVLQLHEVTTEVAGQEALRQTRDYHGALVRNALDSIAIFDRSGFIRYQSPASFTWLGIRPEELEGRRLDLPFAEDRARVAVAFRRVREAPGRTERVLYRMRDRQGAVHWIESILSNQLDNPAVGGVVANSRDMTERRQLEQGLREAERMRVAGLLAAMVAHDLNNMMSVVMVGLEQVGDLAPGDQRMQERLDGVRAAISRSTDLARRLMSFARQKPSGADRVDLGNVVKRIEQILRPALRRGQRLELEIDEGSHPVLVDVVDLEQAILNLVINARDAMEDNGRVRVRVQRRPGGEQPWVALVVEDDGPGMADEVRLRALEPFFTTKGPEQGTGLGLVVVSTFARDAGGELVLRSSPGQGTQVELLLPIDVGDGDASTTLH